MTMEGNDFLGEETSHYVDRYERMLRSKGREFFEPEAIELIADHYISHDKLKKALEVVLFGLDMYPNHIGLWIKKAEVHIYAEKFEKALIELEKAELYEPFNPDILLLKGEVHVAMNRMDEAELCFEKALQHGDDRNDLLFEIGFIYQDYDYFAQAAYWFEFLIQESKLDQAYYEAAGCYDLIGNYQKAADLLNELINRDPYNATAWYNLGLMQSKLNKPQDAIESFDLCLAIEEDFSIANFNKANCLVELDRFEEALEVYAEVVKAEGGDSITFCNMGGCYERLGNNLAAREHYKKASKINPNLAEAWFGMGLSYDRENYPKEALQYFRRAVLLEPEHAEYLLVLAEIEYRLGDTREADILYQRLCDLDPGMMEAWLDRSYAAYQEKDLLLAIQYLNEALSYDGLCHQYYYRLCAYHYENGELQTALQCLTAALKLNPADVFLLFNFKPDLAQDPAIRYTIESFGDSSQI
ncbi:MAG: tetratricopeptide repeat protein [Bacteroidia bacterium]|nr:tetratricopeptide repeat protein [Bacteroidia bacterium]